MKIVGKRINIRPLKREDVDQMEHWSRHKNPLLFHYNFPQLTNEQKDQWYKVKSKRFFKRSFTIENKDGEVIGYLSIRDIKWIRRESELGIVLNSKYMNEGYGTEAIQLFLDYYFKHLKMKSMILRAAKFNERAIKCYTHCGFLPVKESLDAFEDQYAMIFYDPAYRHLKKLFTIIGDKKFTPYVHMRVTKQEFYRNVYEKSTKILAIVE